MGRCDPFLERDDNPQPEPVCCMFCNYFLRDNLRPKPKYAVAGNPGTCLNSAVSGRYDVDDMGGCQYGVVGHGECEACKQPLDDCNWAYWIEDRRLCRSCVEVPED